MTKTPTDDGRLHIEHEHRGVRLVSSYAMVLDATGVLMALIWTSMMPTLEMQGTRSGTSSCTQRRMQSLVSDGENMIDTTHVR